MKEVTTKEVRDIAENIVNKTNESSNNYDAIDDVTDVLTGMLQKMNIVVNEIKNNPNCKCTDCKCKK